MSNIKKTWFIFLFLFFAIIILLAINQFTEIIYDLNLYEYISYSQPLTKEESTYLKEENTLYFTSNNNAPPFSFKDKNTNLYKGYVLDYVLALSIELNTEIQFVPRVWDEAVNSVIEGNSHMTELSPSKQREKYMNFTKSIYNLNAIIVTRNDQNDIKNSNDIKGKKIAVESGDYANEYIKNNISNVYIISAKNHQESINLLLEGKVDAILGDEPVLIHITSELGIEDKIKIIDEPLYQMEICIGLNKTDYTLLNILNKAILSLKKNDFAPKIQQKWFGISAPIHKDKINAQMIFLLIIILTIIIILAISVSIWTYLLKKQVQKQTKVIIENKNDLQLTFDAILDFLILINENELIENVNKSFLEWLAKDKKDIIQKNYKDIPLLDLIKFNTEKTLNEVEYKGRFYKYFITYLEAGKKRALVSIQDNTNEIISRRQMLQQNKMIAVGQLAAGLAHEIRNPLGIIRNYCYVLKNKLTNKDTITEKSIKSIEASVLRASNMVENLLDFSRINENEYKCIFLKAAINDIIALEKKSIDKKDIRLSLDCDDDIEFCTKIESLSHIILNLLTNAIDAVSVKGKISISCYKDEDYLYIDFKDNGQGIEEHRIEHIFNPFYSTKKTGQGTGLGLFIVYNEIQKINGEINVISKLNKGTEFKLKFKLKENNNERV